MGEVEVNISKEQLFEMIQHAASTDEERVVYEFRKDKNGNLSRVVDITDHVEELESQISTGGAQE